MQIIAKYDRLCELAEEHEQVVRAALADGVVTEWEHRDILHTAAQVRRAANMQAARSRLGMRMIRGGSLDREIMQEVADYSRLLEEERASECDSCNTSHSLAI